MKKKSDTKIEAKSDAKVEAENETKIEAKSQAKVEAKTEETAAEPKMAWQEIPGWYGFGDIYYQAVKEAQDGDVLVEVGTYLGRSACAMAEEIKKSGKGLFFDTIDNFSTAGFKATPEDAQANIDACGFGDVVNLRVMDFREAAMSYEDDSLSFVFLDADHTYEGTAAAIKLFFPKMKKGGVIAGDDMADDFPETVRAVRDLLPGHEVRGRSFRYRVGDANPTEKKKEPPSKKPAEPMKESFPA